MGREHLLYDVGLGGGGDLKEDGAVKVDVSRSHEAGENERYRCSRERG